MIKYAFWNNKGGTGKTSLAFQVSCAYAHKNTEKKVLVIDACPQGNLSELFLGGLNGKGNGNLLQCQGKMPRCSIGGYFEKRMSSAQAIFPDFTAQDYITSPFQYNENIPKNVDLVAGDPLLELQSNAINALANIQSSRSDNDFFAWFEVVSWLNDFLRELEDNYDIVFIDCNPSFSMYTQIALAATDLLILPVTADDSSCSAIQNAFSLIYGFKLPSEIYAQYAYAKKIKKNNFILPKVHLIVKNKLTQYMGNSASAYATVFQSIERDIKNLLKIHPEIFTFENFSSEGKVDIRDFQTTGAVSFARGCPFYSLSPGRLTVDDKRVQINQDNINSCMQAINALVDKIN